MGQQGLTITVRTVFPDGDTDTSSVSTSTWDVNGVEMGELLRRLLAAMGFAELTIDEIFGDDKEIYSEAAPETPIWGPSVVDTLDCSSNLKHALDTIAIDDNYPCRDCAESCADTACLIKDKRIADSNDPRIW
jgi:hypothetical protein